MNSDIGEKDMLGKILCFFGRHRWRRISVLGLEIGMEHRECQRADCDVSQEKTRHSGYRWVGTGIKAADIRHFKVLP